MLESLINKKIDVFEKRYDFSMDYARSVLALGAPVYERFLEATQIAGYQGGLPDSVWHAAQLVAILEGDCGPCVQLGVKLAEEAGVASSELAAIIEGRLEDLPEDTALGARFSRALLRRSEDLPTLREGVFCRFGLEGQVAIAYAVIASGMYPTLKYAIGYGESCSRVQVGGQIVTPGQSSRGVA